MRNAYVDFCAHFADVLLVPKDSGRQESILNDVSLVNAIIQYKTNIEL